MEKKNEFANILVENIGNRFDFSDFSETVVPRGMDDNMVCSSCCFRQCIIDYRLIQFSSLNPAMRWKCFTLSVTKM